VLFRSVDLYVKLVVGGRTLNLMVSKYPDRSWYAVLSIHPDGTMSTIGCVPYDLGLQVDASGHIVINRY